MMTSPFATQRGCSSDRLATQTDVCVREEFLHPPAEHTACLITDVQMPGMNGVDLPGPFDGEWPLHAGDFRDGLSEEGVRARVLDAGAFGFLGKPFSEECLIACLDRALEHYRSRSRD